MKHQSKLSQEQQHNAAHELRPEAGQEFAGAEELLRFDAAHTMVPPEIEQRLKQSAAGLPPPPKRSWWQNLFGH